MASSAVLFGTKDNAKSTLSADISSSDLSISLTTNGGALFSQPYNGTCSSTGTAILLNCTGIQATIGSTNTKKMIRNVTDGSVAFITANNTNSLTTTALTGGTTNLWNSGDAWRIDEFVATLEKITTSAYGVQSTSQYEEVLIIARSTDILTVASGSRGYNGTTAAGFASGDSISILVNSPTMAGIKGALYEIAGNAETNRQNLLTTRSGADFYVVSTGSSNAYAATYSTLPSTPTAGLRVTFTANFTNSSACTFNYNSYGAVAIKKVDGATALISGDIGSGQTVTIEYDGTYWQMMNPPGNPLPTAGLPYGTGADGALNVTSGTTTIDCGSQSIVIKNYTNFNVSGGATLTFTNVPSTGLTFLAFCTGTYTMAGTLTGKGFGAKGGSTSGLTFTSTTTSGSGGVAGVAGTEPIIGFAYGQTHAGQSGNKTTGNNGGGGVLVACSGGSAGANYITDGTASTIATASSINAAAVSGGLSPTTTIIRMLSSLAYGNISLFPGTGGGTGAAAWATITMTACTLTATVGAPGDGGMSMGVACAGNFSSTGSYDLSGTNAVASSASKSGVTTGTNGGCTVAASGSGGGSAGCFFAVVKGTITNSATYTLSAGTGSAAQTDSAGNGSGSGSVATATNGANGVAGTAIVTQGF